MEKYLTGVRKQFLYYRGLGEKAMEQLNDAQLYWQYHPESNSIAVIIKHLAGNMLSRFTGFLTTDGEKEWRDRDAEFSDPPAGRIQLMSEWHAGWDCLFAALDQLQESDLDRIVYIRNEGHTVMEAVNRQLAHYPYHIGQIVYLAKMQQGRDWKTLSIARNASADYNGRKFAQEKSRKHFTDEI